jgi:hypothetical protein
LPICLLTLAENQKLPPTEVILEMRHRLIIQDPGIELTQTRGVGYKLPICLLTLAENQKLPPTEVILEMRHRLIIQDPVIELTQTRGVGYKVSNT